MPALFQEAGCSSADAGGGVGVMPARSKKGGGKPPRESAPRPTRAAATPTDNQIGRAADDVEALIERNGGKESTGADRVLHELLAHSMLVVRELSGERVRHAGDAGWIKQFNEACEQSAEFSKQLHAAPPPKPPEDKPPEDKPPEEAPPEKGKARLA